MVRSVTVTLRGAASPIKDYSEKQIRFEIIFFARVERDRPGVAAAGGNSIVVAGQSAYFLFWTSQIVLWEEPNVWKINFLIGGAEGRKSLATVEVYSASEAAWKRLPDLVSLRRDFPHINNANKFKSS